MLCFNFQMICEPILVAKSTLSDILFNLVRRTRPRVQFFLPDYKTKFDSEHGSSQGRTLDPIRAKHLLRTHRLLRLLLIRIHGGFGPRLCGTQLCLRSVLDPYLCGTQLCLRSVLDPYLCGTQLCLRSVLDPYLCGTQLCLCLVLA